MFNKKMAFLPRNVARADMRDQWIARFIANHRVDCDKVMEPFARGAGHGRGERPHDAVTPWLPSDVEICLMAARFDGMPDLIERTKTKGWSDRLRPKANYGAKRTERGERK